MAKTILHVAAAGLLCLAAGVALGQEYPVKPIVLLTPFAPGAGPDLYTRPLTVRLSEQLGQTVVLDSKIGAGGALAVLQTARAAPDGYTLTMITNANLIQPLVQPSIGYDAVAQLVQITRLNASGLVLVVPSASQMHRVEDLVSFARTSPGKLNYGSGGVGTPSHLAAATLDSLAGVQTVHIPFKSANDVVPAMLRGDLQYAFQVFSFAAPFIRSGKLRVLATTAASRPRDFADVPTMNELVKNELFVQESWTGIAAPAHTPAQIVRRLFAEIVKACSDPTVQKGMEAASVVAATSESPEQQTAYVKREADKWREIVKLSGIKAE